MSKTFFQMRICKGCDEQKMVNAQGYCSTCAAPPQPEYTGKCFRHQLRFQPSAAFDNHCPACYWELKHSQKVIDLERMQVIEFKCPRCGSLAYMYSSTLAGCTNCGNLLYTEIPPEVKKAFKSRT